MPILFRAFVMVVEKWRAGSGKTLSRVVSTRSSFLLYSAQANFTSQALLTVSLMSVGGIFAAPTWQPFSTERIKSWLCLTCGVNGAEGAWATAILGASFCFLFLVGTSLNPVVSILVAVMAAQVCFVG